MWIKIEKTKVGAPIVVDLLDNEVVVFLDYPSQQLFLDRIKCASEEEAVRVFKEREEWVKRVAVA